MTKLQVLNILCFFTSDHVRASLQGGRVTLASRLTPAREQKTAWVYKQNFTGRITLQPGQLNALLLKMVWKSRVCGLTLPGVFTMEQVNPPVRVTLAYR